ncbi:hypothetical protein [Streptomyces griseus]|uniref:hypothetical protein n=1 Tax=Streptomyces griseus TaxID=1911 RepID=UPI0033C3F5B3
MIDEIQANYDLLVRGWIESIDYRVKIPIHNEGCANKEEGVEIECACPTVIENRAKGIKHAGLLEQLRSFALDGDPGHRDDCERGAPNKPGSRPPGMMAGFNLLDEITCEANMLYDQVLIDIGNHRELALVAFPGVLSRMTRVAQDCEQSKPDTVREIRMHFAKWVRDARKVLSHDERASLLANTLCGECGGGLAAYRDTVKCIGTPEASSCGVVYGKEDWLDLLGGA